ncbi:MAG: enoyl-CoA hydratase/isomerase family protein [Smithellaceae bacterium]
MTTTCGNYQTISLKKEDAIATITLNRPDKLNPLSPLTFEELEQATVDVANDPDVRVVVLTGAGRAFSAGGDLESSIFEMTKAAQIHEVAYRSWQCVLNFRNMDKIVIAAVNGAAVGGAMTLVLACDLIIASEKAIFLQPFVTLGLHPEGGITNLLPRLIGVPKALELFCTGRSVDAKEADRIGLVNQVVPADQLETTVKNLAVKLAQGPAVALRLMKKTTYQAMTMDLPSVVELEARTQAICMTTDDFKEGVSAFKEKRKPVFKGK